MVTDVTCRTAVSADGTEIAYWQTGNGDPLVLVHGATGDHTRWDPLLPLLTPHATACAVDRRGRGGSGDATSHSIARESEDVAAVVEAIALDRGGPVDVFAHSYGALCSLEAALLTTSMRRLVLYEAPTHADHDAGFGALLDEIDALVAADRRAEAVERFFLEAVRSPKDELELLKSTETWAVRVANAHTMAREARAVLGYRFEAQRFAAMAVPTLVLVGGEQSQGMRDAANAVAEALPNATVSVLEGQLHMAMDTAPGLVVERVLAFFDRATT